MTEMVTGARELFAERVSKSRQRLGLNMRQVCARMESRPSPSTYHGWENGFIPRMATLHELADALEVSVAYLQGFSSENDPSTYPQLQDAFVKAGDFQLKRIDADHDIALSHTLYKRMGLSTSKSIWVAASDSSMAPTINKGDKVLIDLANTVPRERDLYALLVEDRIWFRWIQPELDRSYSVFEEGAEAKGMRIEAGQLETLAIAGRVSGILRIR